MPPKIRNGEGSLRGSSLLPVLPKQLPPVPRQRRSGGRSGAASAEGPVTQSGSSSKGVTAPPWQDNSLTAPSGQGMEFRLTGLSLNGTSSNQILHLFLSLYG
ncbi:hypothetical protein AAC387_Pa02g3759 [Persea americana]